MEIKDYLKSARQASVAAGHDPGGGRCRGGPHRGRPAPGLPHHRDAAAAARRDDHACTGGAARRRLPAPRPTTRPSRTRCPRRPACRSSASSGSASPRSVTRASSRCRFQDKRKDATEAKAVIDGLDGRRARVPRRRRSCATASRPSTPPNAQDRASTGGDRRGDASSLNAIYEDVQTSRPEEELQELRDEKQFYERQQAAALADGNPTGAASYQSRIEQVEPADLRARGRHVGGRRASSSESTTAEETLATAQEERAVAASDSWRRRPPSPTSPSRLRGSRSCARRGS